MHRRERKGRRVLFLSSAPFVPSAVDKSWIKQKSCERVFSAAPIKLLYIRGT